MAKRSRSRKAAQSKSLFSKGGESFLVRFGFVFLMMFMVITINLPTSMLARFGIEPTYIYAALVAIILAGLTANKPLAMAILVIAAAAGANLPPELAELYGVNQDLLIVTLVALVLAPTAKKWHS